MINLLGFIPQIFNQIKGKKNIFIIILIILFGISAYINYFQFEQNNKLANLSESQQEIIKSRDLTVQNLNQKIVLYEREINKMKIDSQEQEIQISKLKNKVIQESHKSDIQSLTKWNNIKFINNCESDINHLRNHALELKGKWK